METDVQTSAKVHPVIAGSLFGVVFGFLLQKGGVADYGVLIGALRLTDPTVFQVILSAILIGGIASALLRWAGLAKAHPKPARYASNVVGGLIFGTGFGLLGYCPGTGAAALGQGSWDAGFGVIGLLLGSYFYAATATILKKIDHLGDHGKVIIANLFHLSPAVGIAGSSIVILAALVLLRNGFPR
ncbi:MAG: DUF6691 family protein [Planctomycetota bacterium]